VRFNCVAQAGYRHTIRQVGAWGQSAKRGMTLIQCFAVLFRALNVLRLLPKEPHKEARSFVVAPDGPFLLHQHSSASDGDTSRPFTPTHEANTVQPKLASLGAVAGAPALELRPFGAYLRAAPGGGLLGRTSHDSLSESLGRFACNERSRDPVIDEVDAWEAIPANFKQP
jgi:hypothetical protein